MDYKRYSGHLEKSIKSVIQELEKELTFSETGRERCEQILLHHGQELIIYGMKMKEESDDNLAELSFQPQPQFVDETELKRTYEETDETKLKQIVFQDEEPNNSSVMLERKNEHNINVAIPQVHQSDLNRSPHIDYVNNVETAEDYNDILRFGQM